MEAYKTRALVRPDGTLELTELPFEKGSQVEVIVLAGAAQPQNRRYPLRGTDYSYEDPFGPAASDEEWEAIQRGRGLGFA
jgi:hypothetical protein